MMPALLSPEAGALSCPPAEASAHAWMPHSPCGASCVDAPAEAGTLRVAVRLAGVAGVLLSFPLAHLATPRRRRAGLQRRYARALLACCGIRVRVLDNRGADKRVEGGLLVVARHVGWTDIVALTAVEPMGFVARADLIDWPMLGEVARKARVIPIERERLRALPEVIATMVARVRAGERIAFYPEGTTWCGRAHGTLRPALFQAAIDAQAPVQPLRLRYLDRHGELSTVPGFVGTDSLADSIRRVLRSKGVVAEIALQPLEYPTTDRFDLARRCERALEGDIVSRAFTDVIHGSENVEAVGTGAVRHVEVTATPSSGAVL
ncbi:lysophospholipid acyltransferase family protein [Nocardia sp. CDC160]|uniref:lysophospholipid acyltransferase family protein n=1 Tax=Nocardia sp. CDC160 TaxID=3112166 RepID=UPI002DB6A88A|nr:lysophospholipid acyltransferase family protein [Nocardia sp. CDC160]MEC3915201.1 lysophospholipid acyltransferase family protein [Nocardia sp. CDC160]